jgi:hypothetical protein
MHARPPIRRAGGIVTQHRTFLDLTLDDAGLHTPEGVIELSQLSCAEVVRHRSRAEAEAYHYEYAAHAGTIGGALVGGALAGPAGFIGGGLLGSAFNEHHEDADPVPRTVSATVRFESPTLAYAVTVDRSEAVDAETFVNAVKKAAGLK